MGDIFDKLNAPFRYEDYEVNKDDGRVYVKGQAVTERLNEVLGVGYWKYEPITESIKVIDTGRKNKHNQPIKKMFLLVKFSFFNKETGEWINLVDAGSQDMNKMMEEGDATKSAITDGLKKCASRIGVASDLYKGEFQITKDNKVLLPARYKKYYEEKGWKGLFVGDKPAGQPQRQGAPQQQEEPQKKASKANPLQQLQAEYKVADDVFNALKKKYQNNPQKIRQALEHLKKQKQSV